MNKFAIATCAAIGCLGVSTAFAASTDICDGTAAHNGTAPASGTAGTNFMVTAIAPKCSANVFLKGMDGTSGAWYAVGSVSSKGKSKFGGHTNGGAVANSGACAIPGGCTDAEAGSARSAANTAASAS